MRWILLIAGVVILFLTLAAFNPPYKFQALKEGRGVFVLNRFTGGIKFCTINSCRKINTEHNAPQDSAADQSHSRKTVSSEQEYEAVPVEYDPFAIRVRDLNKNMCVRVIFTDPASGVMNGKQRIYTPPLSDADIAAIHRIHAKKIGSLSECP